MNDRLTEEYFHFLCENLLRGVNGYTSLCAQLHSIKFKALVRNDYNRSVDGEYLRDMFFDTINRGRCTLFEMLLGLSFRLEFEVISSKWEKDYVEWFWILIDNLGLMVYDDESYILMPESRKDVENICNRLLNREYGPDGFGGLFPLKYTENDQRKVEIWYQMTEYIKENYPIEF